MMTKRNTNGSPTRKSRLGTILLLSTGISLCGAITMAQTVEQTPETAPDSVAMTAKQKKQMQMRKMQAAMAAKKRNAIPRTTAIYDPAGGFTGRNVKRGDTTTCLQWRGGPKGTLVPMDMTPPPVPMPGTHGMAGLSYNAGCDRAEAFTSVSTRADNFFLRGTVYSEALGSYNAPGGVTVGSGSDRLSYALGAGYVAQDGSFLSFDMRKMRRDEIRFPGASADTRQFDVDRYDIAGKLMLNTPGLKSLSFSGNWTEMDRINDNFTYRTVAAPATEVHVHRETADARVALDGESSAFAWTLGLEYSLDRREATRYQGAALVAQSPNFADAEVSSYSITADGIWDLAQDRRIKGGLRLDRVEASLGGIDRTGLVTGGGATPTPRQLFAATYGYTGDGTASEINPSAYLRYEQDLKLQQGKGRYFAGLSYETRTATPFERYFTSFTPPMAPAVLMTWIGNPDLDPERHLMIEAGAGMRSGPWTLAGRAYADYVKDYILWDRARGQAGVIRADGANIFRNVNALIGGVEASAKYEFGNGYWAGADVWLTRGQNTTDNRPIGQIPPLEAALKLGWTKDKWAVQGTVHMVAKSSRLDDSIATGSGVDAATSGYALLDLEATWSPRPNMSIGVGINNVLDKAYVPLIERRDMSDPSYTSPVAPGRSVWVAATIRF